MIQTILFFALGFLSAAFLALLLAPSIWDRAVQLTRRRMVASLPQTSDEIQAARDGLRAEFAMTARRLEMDLAKEREKAATRLVEITRLRDELKAEASQTQDKSATIVELGSKGAALEAELAETSDRVAELEAELAEANKLTADLRTELKRMEDLHEEASFQASSRQIELVAQESRIDKLSNDATALRGERKEADRKAREAQAELRSLKEVANAERKKISELERKLERLTSELSDREERLDRRESEIARLRKASKQDEGAGSGEERGDALLREEIATLAAEVVHLAQRLEGDAGTAIAEALSGDGAAVHANGSPSLADRIRALQAASSSTDQPR